MRGPYANSGRPSGSPPQGVSEDRIGILCLPPSLIRNPESSRFLRIAVKFLSLISLPSLAWRASFISLQEASPKPAAALNTVSYLPLAIALRRRK
ncbi:MAG: hypothetical protein QXG32_04145 [Candidatus Bathyarchaeia archaeon]